MSGRYWTFFGNHLITYVQHLPRSELEALAIAQHHDLPTRFLDWTTNPLVTIYFATRETTTDDDGRPLNSAVYVLIGDPPRYADLKRNLQPAVTPVRAPSTTPPHTDAGQFGLEEPEEAASLETAATGEAVPVEPELGAASPAIALPPVPSPFEIKENVIYDPPHVSPRIRAQDSVLLACHQPLEELEEKNYLEIIIRHDAHDDIRRRLEQYGVLDKPLFPDPGGIAKWRRYRVFDGKGTI